MASLVAHALLAPARLMLREQLSQSERKVEALAENTGLTIANCSQQLRRAALPEWREDARPMVMVSP